MQSDSATMQFFAPFAGAAIGEYFRDTGRPATKSFMMTFPSRLLLTVKCRSYYAARRAVRLILVTCFIFIAGY